MNDLGRQKILIPLTPEQLTAETIQEYLPTVLETHFKNTIDYQFWLDYFKGDQPIRQSKVRYNGSKINNIIVVNHAWEAVNFLKGHLFGNPVKYSKKETDQTDDIDVLNMYMLEQDKATLNTNLAEAFFATGIGHMWCYRRKENVDITKQAPFELRLLDNQNAFVAYSTAIQGEPKLFSGIVQRIKGDTADTYKYSLTIHTRKNIFIYEYAQSMLDGLPIRTNITLTKKGRNPVGVIPVVEYPLNNTRQGVLEIGHMIEDAINMILSNNVDDIQQRVNAILVFINQILDPADLEKLREMGAICITDPDNQRQADAKYVVNPLDHTDIRNTLDMLESLLYGVRGIPRPSSDTNINNNTGQSSENNSGRTWANTLGKNYEQAFRKADRELFDAMVAICKVTPDCPVDTITSSDIEITFNSTRSDNLLVKVQSLAQLISINMPKEIALNIVGLVADARETAKLWDAAVALAAAKDLAQKPAEVIEVVG